MVTDMSEIKRFKTKIRNAKIKKTTEFRMSVEEAQVLLSEIVLLESKVSLLTSGIKQLEAEPAKEKTNTPQEVYLVGRPF